MGFESLVQQLDELLELEIPRDEIDEWIDWQPVCEEWRAALWLRSQSWPGRCRMPPLAVE